MASVNKVIIVGHLGQDPTTRYLPDGTAVTNISVATTETWKDKASGEKKEATEWHRVSFWGRLAEVAGEYLKKSALVYVEGKLQTRKWQDKEGVDRYSTEVVLNQMQMLGSKPRDGGEEREPDHTGPRQQPAAAAPKRTHPPTGGKFDDMEDDIPF